MKTLYVSDLDGTLITSDECISAFTATALNELVSKGVIFSYATARSIITAQKVTAGFHSIYPVVVYNGAFLLDAKREIVRSNFFSPSESNYIKEMLTARGIYPIVYSYTNGKEQFSFFTGHTNKGKQFFLDSRQNDVRRHPTENAERVYEGDTFYYSCIGSEEELETINTLFKSDSRFHCIYQKDIYSGEQWCEILPAKATKAGAVLQLKELLGCDKIVSFGDGQNDLSMFGISDECYAVENAVSELKEIATAIIGSNNRDGVAKWLKKNVEL